MSTATPARVEHHFVDVHGLRTFYRAAGQPDHPVIVLLHGFPSSSHMYRDLVWQAYFRTHQPKTLVAWGRGDPFFGVPGAEAFRRDLKEVRVELLDSGHFALEEDATRVAELINQTF